MTTGSRDKLCNCEPKIAAHFSGSKYSGVVVMMGSREQVIIVTCKLRARRDTFTSLLVNHDQHCMSRIEIKYQVGVIILMA